MEQQTHPIGCGCCSILELTTLLGGVLFGMSDVWTRKAVKKTCRLLFVKYMV